MDGGIMGLLAALAPFLLMGLIFYFMILRPQKKEQQQRYNLLNGLKRGDKIVTIGGIYGTITSVSESKISLEIADGVVIEMSRSSVGGHQDPAKNERAKAGE